MKLPDRYLSTSEVFRLARSLADGITHADVQRVLGEDAEIIVSRQAVSKMLSGESSMIKLALRWIELRIGAAVERDQYGEPVVYFRLY